jgi:cellulose synthase/poly-beta-1,6-N-acetylglucosamine synthase-like glycosyltransferase
MDQQPLTQRHSSDNDIGTVMKNSSEASCMQRRWRGLLVSEFAIYCLFGIFMAASFYMYGSMNGICDRPWNVWGTIYFAKTGIETIASVFAIFYILVALFYRKPTTIYHVAKPVKDHPRIAIAYLCCDDMEHEALQSIVESSARYLAYVVLHDDSRSNESRAMVDMTVKALQDKYAIPIHVLRRSHRVGGKPGAVNNVMQNLPSDIEFLLLCDNDSFLPHNNFFEQALSYFDEPEVAIVQFRNIGYVNADDSHGYKTLSISVDFYDAFVNFMDQFGWSPFLGHNALLRVSAMRKVGGFTPGQLADDIDYSVKLRLQGYAIRYAREITAGERHPLTYESLRKRTQKWTYGCTQILMRWGWAVLKSRGLSPADKMSFFLSVGYYHFQLLLLAYLIIFYIFLPLHNAEMGGCVNMIASAGLILFFTFMPSITYFIRNDCFAAWPKAALYWGFTYGSQDFVMLRAVVKCLFRSHLGWSPTNSSSAGLRPAHFLPEVLFAILILIIAAIQNFTLLLLPTTILFTGKFLVAPYLNTVIFGEKTSVINHNINTLTTEGQFPVITHGGKEI